MARSNTSGSSVLTVQANHKKNSNYFGNVFIMYVYTE